MDLPKKTLLMTIFVVLFSVIASGGGGEIVQFGKNDYLRYIRSDMGVGTSFSEYELCNPTLTDFTAISKQQQYFDWKFIIDKGNVGETWFMRYADYTCPHIDHYDKDCTVINITKNGTKIQECTETAVYVNGVCQKWQRFEPIGFEYKSKKCELIRIYARHDLAYGKRVRIDNVLSFAGYKYDEYVWWDMNYNWKNNLTEQTGQTFLADNFTEIRVNTSEMIAAGQMNIDCSDLRIVNSTGNETERTVKNCNQINTSVFVNFTSTGAPYEMYHGFPAAGTPTDYNYSYFIDSSGWGWDSYTDLFDMSTDALWTKSGAVDMLVSGSDWWTGSIYGNRSLSLNDTNAGGNEIIYNHGSDPAIAIVKFRIKFVVGNGDPYFMIIEDDGGSNELIYLNVNFASGLMFYYYNGGATQTIAQVALNSWYNFTLQINDNSNVFNISVSNYTNQTDSWSFAATGQAFRDAAAHARRFVIDTGGVNKWYIDDFQVIETSMTEQPRLSLEPQETSPAGTITIVLNEPTNGTYGTNTVTINGTTSIMGNVSYSTNLGTNVTIDNVTNAFETTSGVMAEGGNNIWVYAEDDTNPSVVDDSRVFFLLDLSPPTITIEDPTGFYTENVSIPLNYNVTDKYSLIDDCWYSIDNAVTNTTIASCANATISPVTAGTHNLILYTNDTVGHENSSKASFYYYPYNEFHANDSVTDAIITDFSIEILETSQTFLTANGTIHIPLNVTGYGSRTFRFVSPAFNTTDISFTLDNTSRLNATAFMYPSSLSVSVYDETDAGVDAWTNLTFNITVINTTQSTTWYDQSVFFEYTNSTPTGEVTIDISADGYRPRRYYETVYANNVNSFLAFLLKDADAAYVRFHIRTVTESPIESALVIAQRFLNSSWQDVGQQYSDVGGTAAIYLNPFSTYRINVTRTGYESVEIELVPSSTDYRIYLNLAGGLDIFDSAASNITMTFTPTDISLNITTHEFVCDVNSLDDSLDYVGFNITHYNGTVFFYNSTTTSSGVRLNTSINLTAENGTNLTAICFFKKTGFFQVNTTRRYIIYNETAGYLGDLMDSITDAGFSEAGLGLISIVITMLVSGYVGQFTRSGISGAVVGMIVLAVFTFYFGWFDWLVYSFILTLLGAIVYLRGGI